MVALHMVPKVQPYFLSQSKQQVDKLALSSEVQDTDNVMGLLTYYLIKYKENRIGTYSKT